MKADVETQGDFVQSLATEVRAATFSNINDLVTFVNWLDEELSFLVCLIFIGHLQEVFTAKGMRFFSLKRG